MKNNDYEFDIDSILAEFAADSEIKKSVETQNTYAQIKKEDSKPVIAADTVPAKNVQRNSVEKKGTTASDPDATVVFSSVEPDADPRYSAIAPKTPKKIVETPQESIAQKPAKAEKSHWTEKAPKEKKEVKNTPLLSVIFSACFVLCLIWGLFNIKPFSSSSSAMQPIATPAPTQQATSVQQTAVDTETVATTEEQPAETVSEPVIEKTKYKLEEGQMAPKPNQACFGQVSVTNASEINNVISQARELGLLGEEEKVAFNPNAQFNQGSYYQDIMYYLDETILVIAWKEIEEGSTLTMCEIKIADGSQFRMEVFGDIYNENDNSYLSQMIMANNAVAAMNSDKCKARGDGVLVCNRTLYKYNENVYAGLLKRYNCLDNCFVTGSGDMLFTKRLEEKTTEEMQKYIADNDIVFSISFGPLLIENSEMVYGYNPGDENYIEYAFGETEKPYSRCGMGQIDERHYLYVSLNHSDEQAARWTMREFAQHIYDRGIMKSFYGLDGGQTAELIINDTIYNHIDYGAERYTSNCIYFATAIPNGEG